jgi:hypothetical protein
MSNPFRVVIDGQPSTVLARSLELLLTTGGSLVAVDGFAAAQDATWAAHAVPLFSETLFTAGQQLPVQLAWNRFSSSLVFTLGLAGDQVRYIVGQSQLLDALRDEERLTRERRAALEVTMSVRAERVEEFRELVQEMYDRSYGEHDDEPWDPSTASFYNEHPDLAPQPGSQLGIRSESAHDTATVFTLWVSDAQLAHSLGHIWEQREQAWEQAQPAGSATALRQELAEVLTDLQGYGWSLARLTELGENWLGQPVEAEEAQQTLAYLQLQLQALAARHALVSKRLLEQEGGRGNG